ncbi:protein of unknown function [Methylacidimicrobium sp. AP8]|nr:protein of unknown function [Methylacidimicrobium sp. AP8]
MLLCRLMDEEYTRRPFYGSRRMVVFLGRLGYVANRKRVQRLMRHMGLAGMAPGPSTSVGHPEQAVYPYLLRGVEVSRPDQVWSSDITYIQLLRGFVYLVAIIDWYSRRVLGWRISNSLDSSFCVDCLEDALALYGKPEIFSLLAVSCGQGGNIQPQLSGFEESGDPQAPEASKPSRHPFGKLDESVDRLDETIGHPALEESKDAVQVLFERLGKPSEGSKPAAIGPL